MFKNISRLISIWVSIAFIMLPVKGYSLPESDSIGTVGGNVVQGTADIAIDSVDSNKLNIGNSGTPTSDRVIIEYYDFSIGAPETVQFYQPGASSIALNRVTGSAIPSSILGALKANGRVFVINPNGVLFGAGSVVDTAGLVASSLSMSTSDVKFMNPATNSFDFSGGGLGAVVNAGALNAPGGFVALLGSRVENEATGNIVVADLGTIALASGKEMTLSLDAANLISVVIDTVSDTNPDTAAAGVINAGSLTTNGGKVLINSQVLNSVFDNAINNSGIVEGQEIQISGNGDVNILGGTVSASNGATDTAEINVEMVDGSIHIADSTVEANVTGDGYSKIGLYTTRIDEEVSRDINIDNSDVSAIVTGGGTAEVDMMTGSKGMTYAFENYYQDYYYNAGDINIFNDSHVLAKTGSGLTTAKISMYAQDINIGSFDLYNGPSNSVIAEVENSGKASILMRAASSYHTSWSQKCSFRFGFEDFDGGDINVLNDSDVMAKVGTQESSPGQAIVDIRGQYIKVYGNYEEPLGSRIHALVNGPGSAYVKMRASDYYAEGDTWDWGLLTGINWTENYGYQSDNDRDTGSIDMVYNSEVLARVGFGPTTAQVDMVTGHINMDSSSVTAEVEDSGSAAINMEALMDHSLSTGEGTSGDNYYKWSNSVQEGGNLKMYNGSSVLATVGTNEGGGNGSASVGIDAGYIDIGFGDYVDNVDDESSIEALVANSGNAWVDITGVWHRAQSGQSYYSDPDYETLVFYNTGDQFYGGDINLRNNSWIRAETGYKDSESGPSEAKVTLRSGRLNVGTIEITEDANSIISRVNGTGNAYLAIDNTNYSNSYTFDSEDNLTSKQESMRDSGDLNTDVRLFENSLFLAQTGEGDAEIQTFSSGLFMTASEIMAKVLGSGSALVEIDAIASIEDRIYYIQPHIYGGEIGLMLGSRVLADVDGYGQAAVLLNSLLDVDNVSCSSLEDLLGIYESLINGDIIGGWVYITGDSTVHAESDPIADMALIGVLSGDINVENGEVSALIQGEDPGVAAVGMFATRDINAPGAISADGGPGMAGVALLAGGDIFAGNVSASGKLNVAPTLVDLLNLYLQSVYSGDVGMTFPNLDSFASGILLGSLGGDITMGDISADAVAAVALGEELNSEPTIVLQQLPGPEPEKGSIFDLGDVNAKLLLMIANRDIGTSEAPIRTHVSLLGAYSFNTGDIYIDQSNKLIELGLYFPVVLTMPKGSANMAFGFPVMANNGLVHITSVGDMVVNSIVAPQGGVYLGTSGGSIYAGHSLYGQDNHFNSIIGDTLPTEIKGLFDGLPLILGDSGIEGRPHVYASDYSYFSSLTGTIGVGTPDVKNPAMSGGIKGLVRPGVVAVTGLDPSVDIDPILGYPTGYVLYFDTEEGAVPGQVWPELLIGTGLPYNLLVVDIQLRRDGISTAPAVREGFEPQAALTLQFSGPLPPPPPPDDEDFSQFVNPLAPDLRAYYEILNTHRVSGIEPATPTNFFAYHPLTPTDMSAFDGIKLDVGAYDFIAETIKLKKSLAPYFGVE